MHVTKRELWIIGGAIVLIVVAIVIGYAVRGNGGGGSAAQTQTAGTGSATPVAPASPTVTPVPANTTVPNKGASSTPANVAVPVVQSAGNPSGNVSYRSFNISIDGGAYSPSTVIVKQGDTVNLELTAADANYAFTQPNLGFDIPIAKGKTQRIQFAALQVGDFIFYCASCGGPSKGPVGHLIVTAN